MLTVEVLEDGHAEALKDVVDVEEARQHLAEVADYVAPADGLGSAAENMGESLTGTEIWSRVIGTEI